MLFVFRILLKVLALPVVVVLTLVILLFTFLVTCAEEVLKVLSGLGFLLGVAVIIFSAPPAGCLILLAAFLISPFGIPLLANWILDKVADLNFAIQDFITS